MPTSTWGPHVWTFIHTFAYHIDEIFFTNNKKDVIHLLFNICFNLPCMDCTMHAKAYTLLGYLKSAAHEIRTTREWSVNHCFDQYFAAGGFKRVTLAIMEKHAAGFEAIEQGNYYRAILFYMQAQRLHERVKPHVTTPLRKPPHCYI